MAGAESNGRVTLALIGQKLERIIDDLAEVKTEVTAQHDYRTRQEELNKAVKHQIWNGSESRIDRSLTCSQSAMAWVKGAIVPIALAVIVGIIMLIIKLVGG